MIGISSTCPVEKQYYSHSPQYLRNMITLSLSMKQNRDFSLNVFLIRMKQYLECIKLSILAIE